MERNKIYFYLIIFILSILQLTGCGTEKNTYTEATSMESESKNAYTEATKMESESKNVEWQKCYITFLKDVLKNKDKEDVIEFAIRDLDNNGISEIIIAQNGVDITVYTFDSNDFKIYETGNCNYGGTTRLFFSNDSSYPGIFYFHVGGGLEHHGYMTIKENSLIKEELWNYDYSGVSEEIGEKRDKTLEISSDKQLIDESKEVYSQNQDLLFEELNLENIEDEIMGNSLTSTQQPEESKENAEPESGETGTD